MHYQGAVPANLLADVYESLVGAIYLDGGLEPAKEFVLKYLNPEIEQVAEAAHAGNFKSLLQQVARRNSTPPPLTTSRRKGPRSQQMLQNLRGDRPLPLRLRLGPHQKEAEQKAAMNALAMINGEPIPYQAD